MLRREQPGRRGLALVMALLVCGVLNLAHRQSRQQGDPVTGVMRDMALVPAQGLSVRVGRWWHDTVTACFQGPSLARRNRALQNQIHTLLAQNKDLQGAQGENIRLRHLLRFQKKSLVPLLAAEVVAIDPNAQADTLILARGRADGVLPRTVVLAPNGTLVGQVLDVSPHSCSVLLLTDSSSSVGAQVVRRVVPAAPDDTVLGPAIGPRRSPRPQILPLKNSPVGICQGDRAGHLNLTYLPTEADVQANDLVTTSGLGGVFPKGVAIGTVESVAVDQTRSVKTAHLRPAVDFDHLEEVFLRIKSRALPASGDAGQEVP